MKDFLLRDLMIDDYDGVHLDDYYQIDSGD
jgi:hypothetical protein